MNIRMEQYRVFLTAARTGSFSAAARLLGITQPAVSQTIAQVEKGLAVPLMIRNSRGVSLTAEGQVLADQLDHAFRMVDSAEREVAEMKSLSQGRLIIGASDTLCRFFLKPFLHRFHLLHPDIQLHITNRTTAVTLGLLRRGEVELGFVNLPIREPEVDVFPCMEVQDIFVAGRDFPLPPEPLDADGLSGLPLMMTEATSNSRQYVDACFIRAGAPLVPQIELDSHELIAEFAAMGLGVGCVMREFVARELAEGQLRELALSVDIPPRQVGMVCSREIPLSSAAAAFAEMIRSADK